MKTRLESLKGKNVVLFGLNYIYAGKLIAVEDGVALLDYAKIVYETGPLIGKTWQDAQDLPGEWRVQLSAVESFGLSGR